MNNIAGCIVFILIASSSTYGQKTLKPTAPNFSRYFNEIPIDTCFDYIIQQTKKENKSVKIGRSSSPAISVSRSIQYKVLNPKTESAADSIEIGIDHFSVPIGGSQNMESPIVYQHQATKTFYFNDSLMASKSFKRLKSELDALELRFSPIETKKADESKIVYPLNTGKDKNLTTFQISLSTFKINDLFIIKLNHRKIYTNQMCPQAMD